MSIKDTIKAARDEATANGNPFERPAAASDDATADARSSSAGFTRKSAAKAKPSRQAASGVRMVSSSGKQKSKKNMTKEEQKAERKHEREIDDLRYNVTQQILEEREEYKHARKLWWRFLIAGVVCMVLAFVQYMLVNNMGSNAPIALAISALVTMVLSYVVIIIGMIYDWRTIRPMRKDVNSYVQSMSEKRLINTINRGAKNKDKK
ncbi:MAG: hypothetical protein J6S63_12165 [Atopobiaceae bacterium]|nr:hypothetical protein [Atopobiaceae bacterium]